MLKHLLLALVAVVGLKSFVSAQVLSPPLGMCCSPADVGTAPSSGGCDSQCFNSGVQAEWDDHCWQRGFTSIPWIVDGGCHVSEPGLTCGVVTCMIDITELTCRTKRDCGPGQIRCYWDASGTVFGHTYPDCTGHNCWGGVWHVGC